VTDTLTEDSKIYLDRNPSPPIDSNWALVLLWTISGKIIRTAVLCCVWQLCTMMRTH